MYGEKGTFESEAISYGISRTGSVVSCESSLVTHNRQRDGGKTPASQGQAGCDSKQRVVWTEQEDQML